jgi:RNA ligase
MLYQFPVIETINDVLPHIEGRNEFIVADRDDHIIINYAVAFADTFAPVTTVGDAIRRECRGLIFRKSDGQIIRRPFHKFFNVGEKDETQPDVIQAVLDDASSLEKLDGSMVAFYKVEPTGDLIPGSKMGITFITDLVNDFLKDNPNYAGFADAWINRGVTPIFEFCSRSQRIVIDYPEDRLVLTAMRFMKSGNYVPYQFLKQYAELFDIEVVGELTFDQAARDVEGVVLRTSEGHMLKMKCESYVRIHKAKDKITVEKNAVAAIINNEIDDVMADLAPEDQNRVNALSDALHTFLKERSVVLEESVKTDVETWKNKKAYALDCHRPQYEKAATFKLWDNPSGAYQYLFDQMSKSLSKEVNYNEFKETWGFDYQY